MDIEDSGDQAWEEYLAELPPEVTVDFYWDESAARALYLAGYLAGAGQAAADYSAHYNRERT